MSDSLLIDRLRAFFAARGVEAYIVGGTVRDRFLGRVSDSDVDLAVRGDAIALGRELANELGGSISPSSVPAGMMRVALPPSASDYGDGSGASIPGGGAHRIIDLSGYWGFIEDDLEDRDFSINAMAAPLASWHSDRWAEDVIDLYGGRADLMRKTIRAIHPDVFAHDPGRMLRALRLAGELKLRIEPDTVRMLAADSHLLPKISSERMGHEFFRLLAPSGARARVESLDRLGLLQHIIPELMATKGVDQPSVHYWDVWGHTLHTLESVEGVTGGHQNSPIFSCVPWTEQSEAHFEERVSDGHTRRTILKLAALFHDIAKPQTKALEADGRTHFFGHSEQGAAIAQRRLTSLRLSARGVDMVSRMVEYHLRPTNMSEPGEWPTSRAIYRYFRSLGDVSIDTLYLCMADFLGTNGPELTYMKWLNHAKMVAHVLHVGTHEPVAAGTLGVAPRLVTGRDLMSRFQLQPGPQIGNLLEAIEEARAVGEIETQEQGLQLAAAILNKQG